MRVAIAQARAPLLDLDRSIEIALAWIDLAGREKVELLAFGEAFLGGYPVWVDWPGWAEFTSPAAAELYARLRGCALRLDSEHRRALAAACRDARVAVAIGAHERSAAGKALYNSLLVFDRDGTLVRVRRKLVPTHGERLCWAPAPNRESAGLEVATAAGTAVGALLCWEHWMPLARQTLHRGGETVHIAAFPHGSDLHQLAARHYAFEGACFVLLATPWTPPEDVPEVGLECPAGFAGLAGGSAIVAPDTSYVRPPIFGREELIVADLDLAQVERAAFRFDAGGHSDRPDLLDDEPVN